MNCIEREERERAERAKREEELREYQERVKKLEEVERKKRQRELEIEERERRREEERRLGEDPLSRKVSREVQVCSLQSGVLHGVSECLSCLFKSVVFAHLLLAFNLPRGGMTLKRK